MDASINHSYLQEKTKLQLKTLYQQSKELPMVVLAQFLTREMYNGLKRQLQKIAWEKVNNPLERKYNRGVIPKQLITIVESKECKDLLAVIIGKPILRIEGYIYQFQWRDYTIISDEAENEPGIDLFIDLTDDWPEQAGGALIYVDGTGDYTKIPLQGNLLAVTHQKQGIQKFVKYVNHFAEDKKRYFILARIVF